MRLVTRRVVRFVSKWEGFRAHAYKAHPSEQYWTIGFGHYGLDVQPGDTITKREAKRLLRQDLRRYARSVDNNVKRNLTRRQRDGLVSFTYNVGIGALKGSTLKARLNADERKCVVIREELPRWVYAGGERLPGLERRRRAEVKLACG